MQLTPIPAHDPSLGQTLPGDPLVLSRVRLFCDPHPHGLYPARLLCPWDSPVRNTGVGCHALLQWIFLKPGIEPGSPALQADALPREPLGNPGGPRHRGEHLSRVLCLLVQSPSHARLLVTPWTAALQVSLSLTQPCPTLDDPVDCSTPGLPVPHPAMSYS